MGLLGGPSAPADTPVCAEEPEVTCEPWLLRPTDVVRALNSCGRGEVISERQLRRHRNRAGYTICQGRKIDFVAYAAWLTGEWSDRESHSPEPINARNIRDLLERQGFRCALTGRRLEPQTAALDHIVPVSRGGEHRMENVQILQKQVNRVKHTLTNEEFIALCREVVAHADSANSNHKEAQS